MNRRIDFTKTGGFPLTQYTVDFMQKSFREAFMAMSGLIGDKVIISGMEEVGGVVSDGWISYNGELIPFTGGAVAPGAEVVITEATEPRVFDNTLTQNVYFTKTATLGTPGAFLYTDLKRIDTLKTIGVPAGAVIMWSGNPATVPSGYALCDGTGGRPDLRKMFIVGYDSTDVDYDAIGKTGGAKEVTLSSNQQGSIDVAQKRDDIGGGTAVVTAQLKINNVEVPTNGGSNQSSYGSTATIPAKDATAPHENRPPFYVLAYIIKL